MTPPSTVLKSSLRRALSRAGLEVRRAGHPWRPPECPRIGTVIDVGAADGTPDLYSAYPEADLVVIDPLKEQLDRLAASMDGRPVHTVLSALGSENSELDLTVPRDNLYKSSLHPRTALTREDGAVTVRTVAVRRLDDLVTEQDWAKPFVLKVDTEGHDLEVLRGAMATLRDCPVVYTEASLGRRFVDGYTFKDLTTFMFDAGFDLVDVLDAPRTPDRRTAFLDCVWTRVDDDVRSRKAPDHGP
jgi:FkbM family methyltransferase